MKSNINLNKHRKNTDKAIRRASYFGNVKPTSSNKKAIPVIIGVLLLAALFLVLNEKFFKIEGIPTLSELYSDAGLSGDNSGGTAVVPIADGEAEIHFVDVGQGDCELIKTKSHTVLIDCGEREYYTDVIDYLNTQKIERLDYVVVSHPHSDHMGGMSYILDEFEIGILIMPEVQDSVTPTSNAYKRMLTSITNKDIEVEYAEPGAEYMLDDAVMTLLSPVTDYNDLNNYSVTVKFQHGENSFLFTGDIEKEAEGDIVDSGADVSADVLKIAHHGSTTSSSKQFLNAVSPMYAVIEVGSPNDYGHPHDKTMQRLEEMELSIYRTDLNGDIVFVSDGKDLKIETEKE